MESPISILQQLSESPALFAEIATQPGGGLQLQTRLRGRFDPALVRAALTLHDLRQRARGRFAHADKMWFDRIELEQATWEAVASHKARRFAQHGEQVQDLYCGVGMNAIAFAIAGLKVEACDPNPEAVCRTNLNAAVYEVHDRFEASVRAEPLTALTDSLIHLQPVRPAGQQKAVKIEELHPGLETLQEIAATTAGGAIALSPACNFGGKFPNCEVELVSVHGECKEAIIWYGLLKGEFAMQATLLPAGVSIAGNPYDAFGMVGPLGRYLHDPDAAVVRAGLVDVLTEQLGLQRLDGAEEYLTGNELLDSPFVTSYEVLADLPNNDREIRNYFRETQIGQVEIRCRHVPVDAAALRRKLPLSGKESVTLIFARLDGKTRALVTRRAVTA